MILDDRESIGNRPSSAPVHRLQKELKVTSSSAREGGTAVAGSKYQRSRVLSTKGGTLSFSPKTDSRSFAVIDPKKVQVKRTSAPASSRPSTAKRYCLSLYVYVSASRYS